MDLILLHTFRGWIELDLYTLLARWGQPPAPRCRFPRDPMEIRRLVNGATSAKLNSLLFTPHYFIMGKWWTFEMPIKNKEDLLDAHIYEYGFLILDTLVNEELHKDCDMNSPTARNPSREDLEPFDEAEWYRRLENEIKSLHRS